MSEFLMNRLANSSNQFQGKYKRVLCVCSAGLLRSPTASFVLSQDPYNFNTRAAGLEASFALIPVDRVLLEWAQEVVCMTEEQKTTLVTKLMALGKATKVIALNIEDSFEYRNPELIQLIKERYDALSVKAD